MSKVGVRNSLRKPRPPQVVSVSDSGDEETQGSQCDCSSNATTKTSKESSKTPTKRLSAKPKRRPTVKPSNAQSRKNGVAKEEANNGFESGDNGVVDATNSPVATLTPAEIKSQYDEFVNTYAVPTHIYRYLAERHKSQPCFLTRNLRYMHPDGRGNGAPRKREPLKKVVDKLAAAAIQRARRASKTPPRTQQWPDEVEVIFEQLKDGPKEEVWFTCEAKVDVFARLAWNWRRKGGCLDSLVLVSRQTPCACNPDQPELLAECTTAESPTGPTSVRFRLDEVLRTAALVNDSAFNEVVYNLICSRVRFAQLEIQVQSLERKKAKNINFDDRRLVPVSHPVMYSTAPLPLFYVPAMGKCDASCFQLTPGTYELRLGIQTDPIVVPVPCGFPPVRLNSRSLMIKEGGIASALNGEHRVAYESPVRGSGRTSVVTASAVDEFEKWPTLRFQVVWHYRNSTPAASVPRYMTPKGRRDTAKRLLSESPQTPPPPSKHARLNGTTSQEDAVEVVDATAAADGAGASTSATTTTVTTSAVAARSLPIDVVYFFTYLVGERRYLQWTRTSDMVCPWCKINCCRGRAPHPSSLLAHLRCCHPRLRFGASWHADSRHLTLEISLDENYDGSSEACTAAPPSGPLPRTFRPIVDAPTENGLDIGQQCLESVGGTSHEDLPLAGGWTGYGDRNGVCRERITRKLALVRHLTRCQRRPRKRVPSSQLVYWRGVEAYAAAHASSWGGVHLNETRQYHPWLNADESLTLATRSAATSFTTAGAASSSSCGNDASNANGNNAAGSGITKLQDLAVSQKRTYFHTSTLQPVTTASLEAEDPREYDSEDEDAPRWLKDHYQRKVEDFSDINKGEKLFMQMWNAYLLSLKPSEVVVSDSNMKFLVMGFVEHFGTQLHRRNLRTNFILHLVNLTDYGILMPGYMHAVVTRLDEIIGE